MGKLKEEDVEVVAAGVGVGKLSTEVGVLAGDVEKLKEEGAGVVAGGVEKVVVAGVEAAGIGTLKVVGVGVGVGGLKMDGAGAGVVNILWGAAGVAEICAGAGVDVGASVAGVGFLKRRIL